MTCMKSGKVVGPDDMWRNLGLWLFVDQIV